ncbi:MAG TPA: HAD family hydrolase [Acidobacteriota bacterium]|nr:HAD family hydrolase [Acidobacteriota bacterium]
MSERHSMTPALLFDLDNTLYHFTPCDEVAVDTVRILLGQHVDVSDAEFHQLHDRVRRQFAERLEGQAASHNRTVFFKSMLEQIVGAFRGDLAVRMADAYWNAFLGHMEPAPHAHEVLEGLAAAHELALVTNQTTYVQLTKIRRLGFERYFPVVVTSEECGIEKPAARMFESALNGLGADAAAAVMIGDDLNCDIRGAAEMGITTIQTTEFTSARVGIGEGDRAPDAVISSMSELPEALSSLF